MNTSIKAKTPKKLKMGVEGLDVAESHGWPLTKIDVFELSVAEDSLMPEGQYTFFHPLKI